MDGNGQTKGEPMKTDHERVEELTAALFAAYLRDRRRMGMGLSSDADLMRRARSDAWKIVRISGTATRRDALPLDRYVEMEETRMRCCDGIGWRLERVACVGLILRTPDNLWYRADERICPHGILARDFVAFYGTDLGSPADVAAFTALPKADLAEDTRRWKEARTGALRDAMKLLRNLAEVYEKGNAGPIERHMAAGILHAAERLEAMAKNEQPNNAGAMSQTRIHPDGNMTAWKLVRLDWMPVMVLEAPSGKRYWSNEALPPHGILARDFVAFFAGDMKMPREMVAEFLGNPDDAKGKLASEEEARKWVDRLAQPAFPEKAVPSMLCRVCGSTMAFQDKDTFADGKTLEITHCRCGTLFEARIKE